MVKVFYQMYRKLKKYIEISPREFRGMVVLIGILLFVFVSPYVYEKMMGQPLKITVEVLAPKIAEVESFNQKSERVDDDEPVLSKGELFEFNPNNLSVENWVKLGLTEKQAASIKKYEAKGGQFRTLSDVKKMYAITDAMYQRIEPYIRIPETENAFRSTFNKTLEKKTVGKTSVSVELNGADSVTLVTVRGIGPAFASRIIKYRNRLGGFIALEQLREVYGVDSAKFDELQTQLNINSQKIQKISINKCSMDDLKTFPYLKYKQANAIIAYRSQHGDFLNIGDLNKIAILSPELIQKIAPYLKFE